MKKVLVIDDTKNIRELLTTCLELHGFNVVVGKNGAEALELFENEVFDLAFLDIKMPEISGTEVFRTIRTKGIKIPVIIMTAYATVKNAIECTKLGAVYYVQKPFTADKINKILEEINIEEKDLDEEIEALKKQLSINPLDKQVYLRLSDLYYKKANEKEGNIFKKIYEVLEE